MLWTFYKDTDDEGWQEYFRWADVGLPLAYMSWQGIVSVKPDGKQFVEDAWVEFCNVISIDPNGKYSNLKDAFAASPNKIKE
jgi:hypothetical protein